MAKLLKELFQSRSRDERKFFDLHRTVDHTKLVPGVTDQEHVFKGTVKTFDRKANHYGNAKGDDEKAYDGGDASGENDQKKPGLVGVSVPMVPVTPSAAATSEETNPKTGETEDVSDGVKKKKASPSGKEWPKKIKSKLAVHQKKNEAEELTDVNVKKAAADANLGKTDEPVKVYPNKTVALKRTIPDATVKDPPVTLHEVRIGYGERRRQYGTLDRDEANAKKQAKGEKAKKKDDGSNRYKDKKISYTPGAKTFKVEDIQRLAERLK